MSRANTTLQLDQDVGPPSNTGGESIQVRRCYPDAGPQFKSTLSVKARSIERPNASAKFSVFQSTYWSEPIRVFAVVAAKNGARKEITWRYLQSSRGNRSLVFCKARRLVPLRPWSSASLGAVGSPAEPQGRRRKKTSAPPSCRPCLLFALTSFSTAPRPSRI